MDANERIADEWRRLCLRRLRRFAQLANTPAVLLLPELNHLSRASLLSAYRDCVQLGLQEEAAAVIAEATPRAPAG
jgi:hypothetical protein